MVVQDNPELISTIVAVLHARTGADFSRFRPATVQRRILNRMISLGSDSLEAYLSLLDSSEDEARELLSRIAIKVSRFYRNASSYDAIRRTVLPELARQAEPEGLRIWSAGCGFGEEPYSLAMLLADAQLRGTVIGTDIDPCAIETARLGVYSAQAMDELPEDLAARHLVPIPGKGGVRLAVGADVRARVRLQVLDLLSGTSPGEGAFDLICCRNVLIYYQSDAHKEIIGLLRRSLRPGGFLFLGEAEWPPDPHASALACVARGARVFRTLPDCHA